MDGVNGGSKKCPVLPESQFRSRLIEEVQRKLKKAVDANSQKGELLRQLFTDVALEVDNQARGLLYGEIDYIDSRIANGGGKSSLCFYQILAEHYAQKPEDGEALLPLFTPLWSQSFASQIFSLLLHRWLFEAADNHDVEINKYARNFITGASQVFWMDVQSNVYRFSSLYKFAVHGVALNKYRLQKIPLSAHRDMGLLVCRFFFFYEQASSLHYLLENLDASMGSALVGGPADVFVTEVTNQLQKIKVEPVLLKYLESCHAIKGVELRTTTSIRLQVALYTMSSPGGPLFPTRAMRHASLAALDHLFPVGRRFRHLISLGFRFLHPYYWPASFFNFVCNQCQGISNYVARTWAWLFERRQKPRLY